jgi:hypothetical protein
MKKPDPGFFFSLSSLLSLGPLFLSDAKLAYASETLRSERVYAIPD